MTIQLQNSYAPDHIPAIAQSFHEAASDALKQIESGACAGGEMTGWYDYPKKAGLALAAQVEDFSRKFSLPYDCVVVVGIGGSYLGTRAIASALDHSYGLDERHKPIVYAGHHLSESGLVELLDYLDGRNPFVCVISKSGTTTEPGVAFRILRSYLEGRYRKEECARRTIAITDPEKGALLELARSEGYTTFAVPHDIGGRFSVLTPVGLVPLALAGYSVTELMGGASQFFDDNRDRSGADHPAIQYATTRMAMWNEGKRIEILGFENPKLFYFVEWWKQLFGESEGKDGKGLFPTGLSLTTDLHSLGQYAQDGVRNLFATYLTFHRVGQSDAKGVERRLRVPHIAGAEDGLGYLENQFIEDINQAARKGTRLAHYDGGVPSTEIVCGTLDAYSLGQLIAFFETACGVSGLLLGVNPFDQPGVEDYKKNLFALMGRPGYEALRQEVQRRL